MNDPIHGGALARLQHEVESCRRCPRLVGHCQRIAEVKRRAFLDWNYWGKPVPSFGDPDARLLIVGLAPGAHGSNRTGRMFTGDASGDFLYDALHRTGFASQGWARDVGDGLTLIDCYITAAVRCAPPKNRPRPDEFAACRDFLVRELSLLPNVRALLALGQLALDSYLNVLRSQGTALLKKDFRFGHAALHRLPEGPPVLCSYHPSRQNTQTGRLSKSMMVGVLERAKDLVNAP